VFPKPDIKQVKLAGRISQPYEERRDSRRGFPAEPVREAIAVAALRIRDLQNKSVKN
jgi:hypothetical protein